MNKDQIISAEKQYVLQTYVRPDVVFTHGKGVYLYDSEGNEYLDFASGIAVTALGHSDPEWAQAVSEQAELLTHVSNLYHTEPQVELARRLVENSFADRVFFCNSGTEANEAAIKFARKWAKQANPSKTKVVAFTGGFHGRSIGALSVTYKAKYREPFAPLMPDVTFAPFNDLEMAEEAIDDQTCAVIVEPVQGEGGVNPARFEFLPWLRQLCDRHNALLIFDEVQCGLGRSGKLWAHELYGVMPDIMTLAKPLAGGLPIGAVLLTKQVASVLQPGDHGSTFAAGPLVTRAASVVFDRINQPGFLADVAEKGQYLKEQLWQLSKDQIANVRGAGLLVGVELRQSVAPVIAAARAKGLIVINAGETVLRLAPPLIVTKEQIDTVVAILKDVLSS
ncbi:MAG: acetylornithine transaminase [Ardenticatenaceae bacterium]|nr:acetylornithine transaminase [Anaerolineales bacterium]MCB8921761.1 acetylornithine transaminase [Ardenticatenaceae bacterium]MCB8990720.1 acetylornithine transaminase [Ardenticatenaceae bacterium]